MNKTLMTAFAAMILFFVPSLAAAQLCHPDSPHTRVQQVFSCSATGVGCDETCVCASGYHQDGTLSNGDPRCVADPPIYGSSYEPLCGFGATRVDGDCVCTGDELGTRLGRTMLSYTVPALRALVEAGRIESPAGLISDARLDRMERRGDTVAVYGCIDPMSAGATERLITDGYAEYVRILCTPGDAEPNPDADLHQLCTDTRALIDSIVPRTTIHYGDRDYTFNEFVSGVLVPKFGEIEGRLSALENTVHEHGVALADHETRISALEHLLRAIHLRFGAFGLLGGELSGPMTGAGGASGELLVRFGDLPVGMYGRLYFGGQSTGWGVGSSFFLAGGAGFTLFTGGRADTTISLGYYGETLLDPYMATHAFPHDSLGTTNGAQLLASFPIPGAHIVRIEAGLVAGFAERRLMDQNGVFRTPSDAFLAGMLGLVIQPD